VEQEPSRKGRLFYFAENPERTADFRQHPSNWQRIAEKKQGIFKEEGKNIMNDTELTVQFPDEKLDALRYFLDKKQSTVEDELRDHLDKTYEKVVPPQVREFVENHNQQEAAQQENVGTQAADQQDRQPRQYHRRQREQAAPELSAVPQPQPEESAPTESDGQGMGMSM
jgi:hypothetical protein